MERKPPGKVTVYGLIAFFLVAGLGLLAGGAFAWNDEHGGTAGTAHVTRCRSVGSGKGSNLYCEATWRYRGRIVTGYVENGRRGDVGKTISGRIHGSSHITKATYWVPIGLWIFGLLVLAVAVMLILRIRSRPPPGWAAA